MSQNGDVAATRKKPVLSLIVVLAIIVGLGVVGGVVFKSDKHPSGPTYPKTWDPRIAPLAKIASKDRGLAFIHPVFVEFLSPKAFDKWVTTDDTKLTSDQKQGIASEEGTLRAQGVISGNVSLLKEQNTLSGSGTLGEYSYVDKKIRVRGTQLTPAVKVTLVHELTHVLQDQHFNLEAKFQQLAKNQTEDSWAFDALVEGDARRIEHEYRASLPKAVQAQLNKSDAAQGKTFSKQVKNVPDFLVADSQAPYDLGEIAVARAARNGNAAVNKLFEVPPVHEIQLMHPWILGVPWKDRSFTKPTMPAGAKSTKGQGRSEYGAYYLYMILAEHLPVQQALMAADGWGGDQMVWYTKNKLACSSLSVVGIDPNATNQIYQGLKTWAAGMNGAAHVSLAGGTVGMQTCDPGSKFRAVSGKFIAAEQFLAFRNSIESDGEKHGITIQQAVCYANGISNYFGAEALTLGSVSTQQRNHIVGIRNTCF